MLFPLRMRTAIFPNGLLLYSLITVAIFFASSFETASLLLSMFILIPDLSQQRLSMY